MPELTATVVGGGIAGMASAVALARAGWRTAVLERRAAADEIGAGVGLLRNGVAAMHTLGLDDALLEGIGHETLATGYRDMRGRRLLSLPADRPEVRREITVWGFHRHRLHSGLRRTAREAGVELTTDARVVGVEPGSPGGPPAAVTWVEADAEHRTESDLVIGADGVWSAVRGAVFPGVRPRYSGSTSWRAIVADDALDGRLTEYWGPGAEFGVLRVGPTQVYWFGYFRSPEGAVFDDEPAAARARFADWAPEIVDLIAATGRESLMRHDVHHLGGGLTAYARGRVVMVGDAAHAMLPTMGQGVATALEDGVCVGRLIAAPVARGRDLARAAADFDADRRPRCRALARQSALVAKFGADLGGGWRQTLRNGALRLVPARALVRSGAALVHRASPAPGGPAAPADG